MATNLRPLARKLQMALFLQRGRKITINYYQVYSAKAARTVTKYVISEYIGDTGNGKYKTIFESWSLPDVVRFLAEQLQRGKTSCETNTD